ncbi:hypothetical protein Vafri_213 [Volvox africanus]|nr:hypothetical protein Vafri_213 [Volvox africanus]
MTDHDHQENLISSGAATTGKLKAADTVGTNPPHTARKFCITTDGGSGDEGGKTHSTRRRASGLNPTPITSHPPRRRHSSAAAEPGVELWPAARSSSTRPGVPRHRALLPSL